MAGTYVISLKVTLEAEGNVEAWRVGERMTSEACKTWSENGTVTDFQCETRVQRWDPLEHLEDVEEGEDE
jgi:hypothetical protein